MSLAFAFFVVALVVLIAVVAGSLRLVDRLLTGDWGQHPRCAGPQNSVPAKNPATHTTG